MIRYLLSRSRVGWARACAPVLLLVSVNAWSLGLGDIELDSALNEEFNGTIELLDASGLAPLEIVVSLASAEDFERVGVERFFFLTDLSFEVSMDASGQAVVAVSSSRPITEPYLNFLVEVLWPNGRLLKEFTVLLDPPTFSAAAAPTVAAPEESRQAAPSAGRVQRREAPSTATRVQVSPPQNRAPAPSPFDQGVVGNEFRMTDRNDTLWTIASQTRPSAGVTVQQHMLAIQRLNPDAFINGNINLLKAGFSLRLPSEADALNVTQDQAVQQVARHNADWKAFMRGEQVASAAPRPAAAAPADQAPSELRSPVDATATPAPQRTERGPDGELRIVAADGDSAAGVSNTAAPQELTAALEENDRLTRELDELTYQLDRDKELSSNQIEVKDRQLEVKDQQIAELQAQLEAAREQSQQLAQQESATQNQNQSTTQPAAWWENPLVQYGGMGALVLALVGGMLAMRRRREDTEELYEADAEPLEDFAETFEDDEVTAFDDAAVDADDVDTDEFVAAIGDEEALDEEETPDSETSDVIGEADIYIAYGRYPQAIGLLLGVLEEAPDRNDVRLKLLELYSETNDRGAFDEHMAALVEHCDEEDALLTARELEGQFGEQSISLDAVLAENDDAAGTAEAELDIEFEPQPETAAEDEFELELDNLDEEPSSSAQQRDDLGGDLGIDFDPDRDVADTEPELVPEPESEPEAVSSLTASPEPEPAVTALDAEPAEGHDEDHINLDDLGVALDMDAGSDDTATETVLDGDLAVAEDDDEFDFQDEGDSANTKLDLARAYIDMGDAEGARDILKEVVDEGNTDQQQQAQSMLESL